VLACLRKLSSAERGNSTLELALAAPILLAAISPLLDLGLAFSQQVQVEMAAQAGAQYAARHGWNTGAISSAVTGATTLASLSATPAPSEACGCPNGTAVVGATCGSVCSNGETAGTYVTVSAQASYTPVLPYSLLGTSTTLSAQSVVRIQ
jgi:Flp pilus assembly protein TadG